MKRFILYVAGVLTAASLAGAEAGFVLRADRPGAAVQPTMYGLFFEDINYAADGGLYAEMVKNRSFEFHPDRFAGWNVAGNVEILSDGPFERNPHYIRLSDPGHREKRSMVGNEGFFGMSFVAGELYKFSVWARCPHGEGRISVNLTDRTSGDNSQILGRATIDIKSPEWQKYTATITADRTVSHGELSVYLVGTTPVDLEHISLFPEDTYKGRENGMRRDIAEALEALHPGVFRFPGGCIVEGADPATRYQWKNTVGPVENRPVNENRWQSTFIDRFFPDYFQSLGLGFYEYFQLCEDFGAEPLPVLNVGMVCQYQNPLEDQIPLDSLQQFIDDACDLIEFANGDPSGRWGAVRAQMGHPEPFGLKFLAIGNEQWGPEYVERLTPFVDQLRERHPEIKIIGSSGPDSEGDRYDYLWREMRRLDVDLVDEHFYRNEQWFLDGGDRYDKFPRKGPKVFAGEYACHGSGKKFNHYNAALLEAAFLTGVERNADVVHMATYAPLLAHVDGWQWRPDLIWFDNSRVVPSASYYVQQLYSTNRGDRVLPLTLDGKPAAGKDGQHGLFASAVADNQAGCYIIKIVNTAAEPIPLSVDIRMPRGTTLHQQGEVITFTSADMDADNTLDAPETVVPVKSEMTLADTRQLTDTLPAKTFRIYKLYFK